ncbi:Metallo-dependent phosphatase-like protein, partial [Schizothecium vesticola]
KKRVIFVGDVHGHLVSLKALLHKLKFDEKNGDHLVFVGDLVNKGPDSAGVVALAMDVGASAVRGNHEDNVLRAHKTLQKKKHRKAQEILQTVPDRGTDGSVFGSREDLTETRKKHDDQARSVAKSLSKKQINWLSSLPLMLRIDHLHGAAHPPWNAKEIIVVHAGLVPAVPLHKQDPWAIMNMRTLLYRLRAKADDAPEAAGVAPPLADMKRHIEAIPSDARQGEPWSHSWNRFQNVSFPLHSDRTLVIYGHDARAGLQANPNVKKGKQGGRKRKGVRYAFGIDSGCGHGRKLTALVLEATGPDGVVMHRLEQV